MLTPYPNEFPKESLALMLDCVRGNLPGTPTLAHHCWNVVGFALGKTLGAEPPAIFQSASDDEILLAALHLDETDPSNAGYSASLFPWGLILQIALKLLQKYIDNV